MLRTDGENIPEEKREMLPRSDVLSSAESANAWLLSDFRLKIDQSDLNESRLCLVAHHFIENGRMVSHLSDFFPLVSMTHIFSPDHSSTTS